MTILDRDAFDARVLELVNQERTQRGLRALTLSQELDTAADCYSQDMAVNNYFSHTGRDGSNPGDRIEREGYRGTTWGENIAAGYDTPEAVVSGWMNSSGHRANILNANFTDMGLGYALNNGSQYGRYWTQVFGAGDPNPGIYIAETNSPSPSPTQVTIQGTTGNDVLTGNNLDNTIIGEWGNDTIDGQSGNDKLYAGSGNDSVSGGDGNDKLYSGTGNDLLDGGNGKDRLIGVYAGDSSPLVGKGEVDRLTGAAGADTFVLGEGGKVYYNDGVNNTLGQKDHALIQDFSQEDKIQLQGSASQYSLGASPTGLAQGTAIFMQTSGRDELLAIVQDVNNLALDSSSFVYVA
jgi:Ca2+-binding RTX toxin-like protein